MKRDIKTFYTFGPRRYDDDYEKPRLIKLEGIEIVSSFNSDRKRVKLTKASPQFGHSTIVSTRSLETTPAAALARYRNELAATIDRLKKELRKAERAFDRLPDEPGKVQEDV